MNALLYNAPLYIVRTARSAPRPAQRHLARPVIDSVQQSENRKGEVAGPIQEKQV